MATKKYILLRTYCEHSKIDDSFVHDLFEYGLVNYEERNEETFIDETDIMEIERMFRLHQDLGINYEGLDVISQMLKRMEQLESEMDLLRKRLRLYE